VDASCAFPLASSERPYQAELPRGLTASCAFPLASSELLYQAELPLACGERVTFLCSRKEKSPKESASERARPRRSCTKVMQGDAGSMYNSVVPSSRAARFACEENALAILKGRVVHGILNPLSRRNRAFPPEGV